jgi:hypothetical protein
LFLLCLLGQGWVWLVEEEGNISIQVSHQFQHPLTGSGNVKPLLALDMWEHSYYLDYLTKIDVSSSDDLLMLVFLFGLLVLMYVVY